MATSHYAWTDIVTYEAGKDDQEKRVVVKRGEKVTAGGLGVNQEEFQAMISAGSIRKKPYPAPDDFQGSAVDYLREQLREATSVHDESVEEAEALNDLSQLEKAAG